MKKIFAILLILITTLSCVYTKVDINFNEATKGDYKITFKVDKSVIPKKELDNEIQKAYLQIQKQLENTGIDLKFKNLGEKDNQYTFEFNSRFNKLEDLQILKEVTENYTLVFSAFSHQKEKIFVSVNNNIVEMYLGKSVAPTTIKVNGKIIEATEGKVKGRTVDFPTDTEMHITYKKGMSLIPIAIISSITLLILIVLTIFGIYKLKGDKGTIIKYE